jgi:hypothetical protein
MTQTRFIAAGAGLLMLALFVPIPAAALDVHVDQTSGFDVYANGASSLDAPQNVTIAPAATGPGYVVTWSAPQTAGGPGADGYVVYRVPGPNTGGRVKAFEMDENDFSFRDGSASANGTYIYFVTTLHPGKDQESIPSTPVSSADVSVHYPHCSVVSIYTSPPYYDVHLSCLFPLSP